MVWGQLGLGTTYLYAAAEAEVLKILTFFPRSCAPGFIIVYSSLLVLLLILLNFLVFLLSNYFL